MYSKNGKPQHSHTSRAMVPKGKDDICDNKNLNINNGSGDTILKVKKKSKWSDRRQSLENIFRRRKAQGILDDYKDSSSDSSSSQLKRSPLNLSRRKPRKRHSITSDVTINPDKNFIRARSSSLERLQREAAKIATGNIGVQKKNISKLHRLGRWQQPKKEDGSSSEEENLNCYHSDEALHKKGSVKVKDQFKNRSSRIPRLSLKKLTKTQLEKNENENVTQQLVGKISNKPPRATSYPEHPSQEEKSISWHESTLYEKPNLSSSGKQSDSSVSSYYSANDSPIKESARQTIIDHNASLSNKKKILENDVNQIKTVIDKKLAKAKSKSLPNKVLPSSVLASSEVNGKCFGPQKNISSDQINLLAQKKKPLIKKASAVPPVSTSQESLSRDSSGSQDKFPIPPVRIQSKFVLQEVQKRPIYLRSFSEKAQNRLSMPTLAYNLQNVHCSDPETSSKPHYSLLIKNPLHKQLSSNTETSDSVISSSQSKDSKTRFKNFNSDYKHRQVSQSPLEDVLTKDLSYQSLPSSPYRTPITDNRWESPHRLASSNSPEECQRPSELKLLKKNNNASTISSPEVETQKKIPPPPPVRRLRPLSSAILESAGQKLDQIVEEASRKRRSAHLEDALTELEQIYNSLQLDSEDLMDRAERRDAALALQNQLSFNNVQKFENITSPPHSPSLEYTRRWLENNQTHHSDIHPGFLRTFERDVADNSSHHGSSASELLEIQRQANHNFFQHRSNSPGNSIGSGQRILLSTRKSTVPDKVADDMAQRKLNKKDTGSPAKQSLSTSPMSFLLCSPLTPVIPIEPDKDEDEPDVITDDVVYRQFQRSTGPGVNIAPKIITPSSPRGYVNAKIPVEIKSKNSRHPAATPDLVKDDLAFRNLRKDKKQKLRPWSIVIPQTFNFEEYQFWKDRPVRDESEVIQRIKKKYAARSLSANLSSIMKRYGSEDDLRMRRRSLPNIADKSSKEAVKYGSFGDLSGTDLYDENIRQRSLKTHTPRSIKQRHELRTKRKQIKSMIEFNETSETEEDLSIKNYVSWAKDWRSSTETLTGFVNQNCRYWSHPNLTDIEKASSTFVNNFKCKKEFFEKGHNSNDESKPPPKKHDPVFSKVKSVNILPKLSSDLKRHKPEIILESKETTLHLANKSQSKSSPMDDKDLDQLLQSLQESNPLKEDIKLDLSSLENEVKQTAENLQEELNNLDKQELGSSLRSRFLSSSSYTTEDKYSGSHYSSIKHDYGVNNISSHSYIPTHLDLASMRSSYKPSSSSTSSRYTPRNLSSSFGTSYGITPSSKLAKSSNVGSSEESLSRSSGRISSQIHHKFSTLQDSSSDKSDSEKHSQRKTESRTYLKYGQPHKKEHHSSNEDLSIESGVPIFLRRSHRMRKYGSESSPVDVKKCSSEHLKETLPNTVPKADLTSSVLERRTSDSSQFSDQANRFSRTSRRSQGDTGLSQDTPVPFVAEIRKESTLERRRRPVHNSSFYSNRKNSDSTDINANFSKDYNVSVNSVNVERSRRRYRTRNQDLLHIPTTESSGGSSAEARRRRRERDKSAKRKSDLNKTIIEQAQLADEFEDAPRKHRRSRYHTSDTPTDSDRKDPNSDYKVPIQKSGSRVVECTQVLSSSDLSSSSDTETYPSKRGVFCRPEIPSVLKRNTPPERSQGFKDDRKPPVPENSIQKSSSFRSTLKRPEGGTAFLLSRRQKSDDDLISASAVFKLPSKSSKDEHFIEDDEGIDVSKSSSKLSIDSNESLFTEESKELELFLPEPAKPSEFIAVPKTKSTPSRESYPNKTGIKQEVVLPTPKLPPGKPFSQSEVTRKQSDTVLRNSVPFSAEPIRKTSDSIVRPTYVENVPKTFSSVPRPSSTIISESHDKFSYTARLPSPAHTLTINEKSQNVVSSGEQFKKVNYPSERRTSDDKEIKIQSYSVETKNIEDKPLEDGGERQRKSSDSTVVPPFLLKGRKLAETESTPTNILYTLKKSSDKDSRIDGSLSISPVLTTKALDDDNRFSKSFASSKLESSSSKPFGGFVSTKKEVESPKPSEPAAIEKRISLTTFHDTKPEHREARTVIPLKQVPITEVKIAEPKVATVSTIQKETSPADSILSSQPLSYQEMVNKVAQSRQQASKTAPKNSSAQRLSREIIPPETLVVQNPVVAVQRSRETINTTVSRALEPLKLPAKEVAISKLEAAKPSVTETAVITIAKVIDSVKLPSFETVVEPPSGIRIHRREADHPIIKLSEPQKVFTANKSETVAKKELPTKIEELQDKKENVTISKVKEVISSNNKKEPKHPSPKELLPVKIITTEIETQKLNRSSTDKKENVIPVCKLQELTSSTKKDSHVLLVKELSPVKIVKVEVEPEKSSDSKKDSKENVMVSSKVQEITSTIKKESSHILTVKEQSPVKVNKIEPETGKSKDPSKPTSPNLPRVPFISKRKASSDFAVGEVTRSSSTDKSAQLTFVSKNEKEKPVLKSPSSEDKSITGSRPSSILKRTSSDERDDATPLSILKKKSIEETDIEPQSIMKKKSLEEMEEKPKEPQSILKIKFAKEEICNQEISSILKTREVSDDSLERNNTHRAPVIKPLVIEDPLIKPSTILKQRSFEAIENESEQKQCSVLKGKIIDSDSSQARSPNSETLSLQSILRKKKETSPFPIRDGPSPELALVLKSRREQDSDSSCEEKFVDAVSFDISLEQNEGEETHILSVAERVYEMETKMEEEKFVKAFRSLPATPFHHSGQVTPQNRLGSATPPIKIRSGDSTPHLEEKLIKLLEKEPISDEQLLSRLVSVASDDRRRRFPRRDHVGERYRTQPITLEEIEETDNSEAVTAFRSLIMRKASFNIFEQREKESAAFAKYGDKKTEYPHTLRRRKGKERSRYKTLPVTIEERYEAKKLVDASKLDSEIEKNKNRKSELIKEDEKREKEKNEEGNAEDELSKMSVSAKTSLFKQLEAQQKKAAELAHQAIGAHRKINKRFQLRSQTQPVTQEEVKTASKIASEESSDSKEEPKVIPEIVNRSKEPEDRLTASDSDEDVSRLSLVEKMKIFTQQPDCKPPPKSLPPVLKKRRGGSRFKTQPVTFEEVEKAAKISPLAVTLIKPPDPDVLSSMPLNAARDFIVKHAEETLKSSSSSCHSDSRRESSSDENSKTIEDKNVKGILKINYAVEIDNSGIKSILKPDKNREAEQPSRGALKKDSSFEKEPKEIRSILKSEKSSMELELENALQALRASGADDQSEKNIDKKLLISKKESTSQQDPDSCESVIKTYQATVRQLQQIQQQAQTQQQQLQAEQQIQLQQPQLQQQQNIQVSMQKQINIQQQVHVQHQHVQQVQVQQPQSIQQVHIQRQQIHAQQQIHSQQVQTKTLTEQVQQIELLESRSDDKRKIGNPAIQRRRNAAMRRMEESDDILNRRSMHVESVTQVMPEKPPEVPSDKRKIRHFGHRSMTAPLTTEEVREAEEATEVHGASIAERLAALHKRGQEDWKKRVSRIKDPDYALLERETREKSPLKSRERSVSESSARSFINETLTQLEDAQKSWQLRIEEKDATQFTVAGKMGKKSPKDLVESSPLSNRKKRTPKPIAFRSKTAGIIDINSPSSPTTMEVASPTSPVFPVSTSTPISRPGRPLLQKSLTLGFVGEAEIQLRSDDSVTPARVEIPKVHDEAFESFFQSVTPERLKLLKIDIDEAAFDKITQSSELLVQKRTVKTQRKHVASKNPLKTLAQRTDLQSTYVEVKTDIAEKELRRIKKEQVAKDATFAQSALAGLASREDFSRISLRKTPFNTNAPMLPYQDLMLLQVKGRRHAQVRLVEPCVKSLNSGDCFVLVTPNEVFHWIGKFTNVIEKSKGSEVASVIQAKKDLGCKLANDVITIEEEKVQPKATKRLFQLLGAKEKENIREAGNPDEDELYEAYIIETNMIYKVDKDQLVPYKEYWGCLPKIEMLESKQVLVFDFGTEMYIWLGKQAPFELRKIGIQLAKELWEEGYDYSDCDINPLHPVVGNSSSNKIGNKRPNWTLFGKQNEFMETVLFREKFLDWPDPDRIIKVKGPESEVKGDVSLELSPYDARLMLITNSEEPSLVLEGQNVGRGVEWVDEMEKRRYDINTLKVTVWHILEYDHAKLPLESAGQFHNGDTYVVRWQYMITNIGARALSGAASRWSFVGRERCAYFFWQGRHSTINEKGASALMTVELDEERGPHVRVVEGKEPPGFLNLFEGGLVIHIGKREEEESNSPGPWKLYIARNELENEGCLVEIPCKMNSLRSRASFLCLNPKQADILIWHGSKAHQNTRKVALRAAEKIKETHPPEIGFDEKSEINIYEIEEGSETEEFCQALGSRDCSLYMSLVNDSRLYNFTPHLFIMSSVSGQFEAQEILCPSRTNKAVCPFPFLQPDLYKVSQPALYLIDNHNEIFLWQGWWPEGDEESENVITGSAKVRWDIDRRCAMETAIQYCKEKDKKSSLMLYLVSAGLEPQSFTNLFPFWEHHQHIAELNMRDGRRPGEMPLVSEILAKLSRKQYSLVELHEQPEGVDPSRLESYLSDAEFHEVLGMSKEEFYALPAWKQTNLKKAGNLF